MNNTIKSCFLILCLGVVFLNFLRKESFAVQATIMQDLNTKNYKRDTVFINSINDFYPSLSLYTIPLKAIKGKYLVESNDVLKGINYLEKSTKENPFLMYSESTLADVYERMGDKNKFFQYTQKAIKSLPNNPNHFVLFARMKNIQNQTDSILYHFNRIKNKKGASRDPQIFNITMASILNDTVNYQKYNAIEIANESVKRFPNSTSTKILADYIIYSKKNVEKAIDLQQKARELFEKGEIQESQKLLEDAKNLNPNNQLVVDDLINVLVFDEMYEKVTSMYSEYLKRFSTMDELTIYRFALSFYMSKDIKTGCNLFKFLKNRNYPLDNSILLSCQI